ncbi:macrolide family glycosyltransferase [Nocardiopsis sp. YSL2]|uniref:macrolide family glycosyltransferase n=1 Tax=Nocardiopsis sp. YSL2 TaxID=2939492 RepID=UPI0026F46663|nr:macrolide family glycosyltransferase [Nocardiopsis sp. YSL2]
MHVAIVVQPAHGHVNPMLPLVPELLSRGHRVTYATGQECVPAVAASGARVITIPARVPPMYWPEGATDERVDAMLTDMAGGVRDSLPILLREFRQDPPDVLCYDLTTEVGRLLAKLLDVPSAAIVPHFAFHETLGMRDAIAIEEDWESADPGWPWQRYYKTMRETAADYGVTWQDDALDGSSVADLNLVLIPRDFQYEADTFDDRFHFIGPLEDSRPHTARWAPADPDRELLYISFGTLFNNNPRFYRTCFEAFGDLDWEVAMAAHKLDVAELGPLPSNFEVRPYFPQVDVMRNATATVSHTGIKTLMDAVTHGVPMVVVPPVPMCRLIAQRAEAEGLARCLDPDTLDAETLRGAVERIRHDQEISRGVRRYQKIIADCGGASRGVDVLEEYRG